MSTDEAKRLLAEALERMAVAHEASQYHVIGEAYNKAEIEILPLQSGASKSFNIAFSFWDGWTDAIGHDWLHYAGIDQPDWPRLAREIAHCLRTDEEIKSPAVLHHFDHAAPNKSSIDSSEKIARLGCGAFLGLAVGFYVAMMNVYESWGLFIAVVLGIMLVFSLLFLKFDQKVWEVFSKLWPWS